MSHCDGEAWRRRQRGLTRRHFLRLSSFAAGAVLLGCSTDDDDDASGLPTQPPTIPATEIVVSTVPGYDNPTVWDGRELTVTSWGGEYQRAQEQTVFEPFQRLTGASIKIESTDLIALRAQVEDDEPEWDLCDVLTDDVLPLANLGLLEELDYNVIDPEDILDGARMDHGITSSFWSTVLAYRTDRWPDRPAPASWADFWNVEAYPGTRGLHREAQTTLEFALLADGVAIDELYPLDIERAFVSLARVLPSLTLWWEQGAQPAQMVTSGDLDMVSAWHSRIDRIREDGAEVDLVWAGGALAGDSWVIPKGGRNRDVAMDLINFATRPEVGAAFAALVPFGPVHSKAFDLLPPEITARLPSAPEPRAQQFMLDFEWWFKHREAVVEQFENWLTEHP